MGFAPFSFIAYHFQKTGSVATSHLFLLLKVQASTPWFAALLLVLANLLPVVGLFAFAKGRYNLAAGLIAVPLSLAGHRWLYALPPPARITSSGCHPER
jgi:hypothetical protein